MSINQEDAEIAAPDVSPYLTLPPLTEAHVRRLLAQMKAPADALNMIQAYAETSVTFAANAEDREAFETIAQMAERGLAL